MQLLDSLKYLVKIIEFGKDIAKRDSHQASSAIMVLHGGQTL